jgi:hypothetical protein
LDRLHYLRPFRSQPARYQTASVERRGDSTGDTLFERLFQPRSQASLNDWAKRFELPYTFSTKAIQDEVSGTLFTLRVKGAITGLDVALPDTGYGISQLLPVLITGIDHAGDIIAVEQPELHLHPRQQGHLADFMIATLPDPSFEGPDELVAAAPTQWIVETHSEALISRFQRRVREGQLKPKEISVNHVEPGPEGARLRELRLDERGEFIDEWPGGFFEETYWDLFGGLH